MSLIDTEQDLYLTGLTWRRLVGETGEWTNRLYLRANDKTSSEGEAYPDLVPEGTPATDVPVRERLITVTEKETEIGWHSDYVTRNRFGQGSAGLRVWQTDVDYSTFLREDWDRFVYRTTDPRPPGQQYITLTPDSINSVYGAKETSYAAYGEQVFEFAHWDLSRASLRSRWLFGRIARLSAACGELAPRAGHASVGNCGRVLSVAALSGPRGEPGEL